jgi:hypothetical protein
MPPLKKGGEEKRRRGEECDRIVKSGPPQSPLIKLCISHIFLNIQKAEVVLLVLSYVGGKGEL